MYIDMNGAMPNCERLGGEVQFEGYAVGSLKFGRDMVLLLASLKALFGLRGRSDFLKYRRYAMEGAVYTEIKRRFDVINDTVPPNEQMKIDELLQHDAVKNIFSKKLKWDSTKKRRQMFREWPEFSQWLHTAMDQQNKAFGDVEAVFREFHQSQKASLSDDAIDGNGDEKEQCGDEPPCKRARVDLDVESSDADVADSVEEKDHGPILENEVLCVCPFFSYIVSTEQSRERESD